MSTAAHKVSRPLPSLRCVCLVFSECFFTLQSEVDFGRRSSRHQFRCRPYHKERTCLCLGGPRRETGREGTVRQLPHRRYWRPRICSTISLSAGAS
ncbi:hypothetical protein GQ53DRAFT_449042 [Thozetella sp. PMI_491]|nr:hypothetical protein GQ53DRAFT_449042 [Thozetella sp. PMI_491]